jgi:hypothetical protein
VCIVWESFKLYLERMRSMSTYMKAVIQVGSGLSSQQQHQAAAAAAALAASAASAELHGAGAAGAAGCIRMTAALLFSAGRLLDFPCRLRNDDSNSV